MSLVNPNQIRHSGMVVSDDPTGKTREFGITADTFHVPFDMQGTTVFFDSRVPTAWEYNNYRIMEMTIEDIPWNPGEGSISTISASNLTMEQLTYRNICALEQIPHCENQCDDQYSCGLDLSAFDTGSLVRRMVLSVHVATAHRTEADTRIAFVGVRDRH